MSERRRLSGRAQPPLPERRDLVSRARSNHPGWQVGDWVELAQLLADDLEEARRLLADAYDGFGTDEYGFSNDHPTNSWRISVERLGARPR